MTILNKSYTMNTISTLPPALLRLNILSIISCVKSAERKSDLGLMFMGQRDMRHSMANLKDSDENN